MRRSSVIRALSTAAVTLLMLMFVQVPPAVAAAAEFKVLLFTKTAAGAYRHDSIPAGTTMVEQLAAAHDFEVVKSEDSAIFSASGLASFDAIIMLQNSGMVWDTDAQRQALQSYVRSGKGVVAIHNTTDMNVESQFPWWDQVLMGGAHMTAHSSILQGTAKVADKAHPSTRDLPDRWVRTEEWYNFDKNFRGDAHVLVTADETTYDAGPSKMGHDHPISWCRNTEGGRVWATAMGHQAASYSEDNFKKHVLGGIKWAAGNAPGDCGGTVAGRFQKVALDSQPAQPMALDVAGDGTVFYVERLGKVKMIKTVNGVSTTTTLATLNVYTGGEDGVIGVAADPDFASNKRIFINYSPAGSAETVRVSRFTLNAAGTALDMAGEKKIIEIPAWRNPEPGHSGGNLEFGPGGNLYIGVGDDIKPGESDGYTPIDERAGRERFDAQGTAANTNDLRGKILRIHPEDAGGYTIPSGNMFAPGTAKTKPEIYVMGWRNPFRFNVDPVNGWISAADYGPDAGSANPNRGPEGIVEWNLIKGPGNYGWPYCIGANTPFNDYNFATGASGGKFNCAAPTNTSPNNTGLTTLPAPKAATVWYDYHAGSPYPEMGTSGGAAPMGGPFYHYDAVSTSDRKFPEYYDKTPFFFEWSRNYIREMRLDGSGGLLKINNFVPSLSLRSPMDMDFGPDGAMYYLDWGIGWFEDHSDDGVYRVDYIGGGNRAPLAKVSATPDSGAGPLQVAFSSAGSSDPDGDPLTYAWDFDGNGTTDSTAVNPTYTYTTNGTYTARLTVSDPGRKTGSATIDVTVGNTRPVVVLEEPPNGGFLGDGHTVSYRVKVTDAEDGTAIDCAKVSVLYAIGHDEHSHDVETKPGCTGSFSTSSAGHDPTSNFFHVLTAKYTDTGGLAGTAGVALHPMRKQAEHFTSSSGIRVVDQAGAENGKRIGDISNNDWIAFQPVNLKNITSVAFRVSSPNNNAGSIELRAGSPTGTLVASRTIPSTGGWDTYATLPAVPVTVPNGTTRLYAVFKSSTSSSPFDLDAIAFNGTGVGSPGDGAPKNGGVYTLTAQHSNKLADVSGNSSADGARVIQWTATNSANQKWKLTDAGSGTFTLTAQHSNKCMGVTGSSTADNAPIQQETCVTGAGNQKWKLESTVTAGVYRIVSVPSNKCLDVPGASTADDVQLIQYICHTSTNQQWKLTLQP
ncbi:ThuA domain-containing protein [Streptomyces monticola]|uniref:ThuA domain-containing protein n=1 Tax=Streptomyces monticola TaxID=2666263 RepID=A0ABW2JRA3_9ACTN